MPLIVPDSPADADPVAYTGHVPPDAAGLAADRTAVARDLGDRYDVRRFIARGGFAAVWEAVDRVAGVPVAVKRLNPSTGRRQDFYRELRAMLALDHPHVVRLVNLTEAAGVRYLILEYCSGGSLRRVLSRNRRAGTPMPPDRVADLLRQIADGLAAAHARGITHRDLKPENVLFATTPGGRAKLADFGLATMFAPAAKAGPLAGLTGSPAYMAPEQFAGTCSPAADVYALGVIGFELLTGELPFRGGVQDLAYHHLRTDPPVRDDLPDPWPALLRGILAKDATARPSAVEIRERLAGRSRESARTDWTKFVAPEVLASPSTGDRAVNPPPDERAGLTRESRRVRSALDDLADLAGPRRTRRPPPAASVPANPPPVVAVPVEAADSFFAEDPPAPVESPVVEAPAPADADWFADDAPPPPRSAPPSARLPSPPPPSPAAPSPPPPAPPANPARGEAINDVLDGFDW